MTWMDDVAVRQKDIVAATQRFLQIESVLDEKTAYEDAPFGEKIKEAYDWLLNKARTDGFKVKDLHGRAGHIEWGEGEGLIGVLCHIDVVPAGDGWTSPAYSADIRDGKIYARGALDDKGPTMACYQALKLLKDKDIKLNKRVRLIIGTDEESQWRCVDHYFKHEEMPDSGFVPDADFPVIFAEKGISDLLFKKELKDTDGLLKYFYSGERYNMVPDRAAAQLKGSVSGRETEDRFKAFLQRYDIKGTYTNEIGGPYMTVKGRSAHGSEPDAGVNAGLYLAAFLSELPLSGEEESFIKTLVSGFFQDSKGDKLGFDYSDSKLGDVTANAGIMSYEEGKKASAGINVRYPEGADFSQLKSVLENHFSAGGFTCEVKSHAEPHGVSEDAPLINVLMNIYEKYADEKSSPIAIGGGTYARALKNGTAFGPLFPGQPDVIHQPDEYISIDHLLKLTAIYTEAIYELAKD